eukprot:scaffold290049_cov32-Prasinocladus_malaysianus.AAC.1
MPRHVSNDRGSQESQVGRHLLARALPQLTAWLVRDPSVEGATQPLQDEEEEEEGEEPGRPSPQLPPNDSQAILNLPAEGNADSSILDGNFSIDLDAVTQTGPSEGAPLHRHVRNQQNPPSHRHLTVEV